MFRMNEVPVWNFSLICRRVSEIVAGVWHSIPNRNLLQTIEKNTAHRFIDLNLWAVFTYLSERAQLISP